ncbi:MAG TPA: NAD(P)/FAD-dependent oxidoreductase, partial [Alphaproteobacteria bacterium]
MAGPFGRFEATRGPQWHYPSLPGRTQARPCRPPTRNRYSASRGRIPLTAAGDMNDETRAGGSGALMAERIEKVVVVGAGHGGVEAAAALRQRGFDRQITLVSAETDLPYQRPPLSKEYIKRPGNPLMLRPQQFFDDNAVTLMLGARAVSIDRAGRTVQLSTGESLSYDHLVLATGARNRKPPLPGLDHPAIVELRTLADANRIVGAIGGWKHVCVIGGGFIGLEAAGLLATMDIEIDVVEMTPRLMQRAVSPTVSQWFLDF